MIRQRRSQRVSAKAYHWLPVVVGSAVTVAVAACSAGGSGADNSTSETGYGGYGGSGAANSTSSTGTTGPGTGGTGNIAQGGSGPTEDNGGAAGTEPSDGGANSAGSGGSGGGGGMGVSGPCADPGIARTFYMSADDSSSMGSPTVAREYLRAGLPPPPALIRTYEFLNYYRVRYPLPDDDRLGVHVHFAAATNGTYRFQVGVQAFEVTRPPMSVTFVVDTSGSLVGEGLLRESAAIKALAGRLVAGDRVNFVTWSNQDTALLEGHEVAGPDDAKLLELADGLVPGGGSDLHAGLTHGYTLAEGIAEDTRLSRLVLISDGGANLGVVDRDLIAAKAKNGEDKGIYLVGIGVGPALGYSDVLMNEVTDQGRGSYVYLDSPEEAEATLGERFEEVMDIAAREVEIAVTIPSYFDIQTSSGETYSQDKDAVKPQHIAPGDTMVLNQTLTVLSEGGPCLTDKVIVTVNWKDPFLHTSMGENFRTWQEPLQNVTGEPWQLLKAEAIFAYARALQSHKKMDFDVAQLALDSAKAHPGIGQDPYASELDDISELIALFPEDAKK
jgi:Ca-activated chloride channel family protein